MEEEEEFRESPSTETVEGAAIDRFPGLTATALIVSSFLVIAVVVIAVVVIAVAAPECRRR